MAACLTPNQLAGLLAETLPQAEREQAEAHIGSCTTCQQALLDTSADRTSCERWPRLVKPPVAKNGQSDTPSAHFLNGLKEAVRRDRATKSSPQMSSIRPTVAGYDVQEELGHGGTAVVYRAVQRGLNRTVALKIILPAQRLHAGRLARFRAEAEAVAKLQHPNIIQVYEVGEANGLPYLALEYAGGGTLARTIAGQTFAPKTAAGLVEHLARAMHYAHSRGLVHRDLKPANVLWTDDGTAKVADFGLAKFLESESDGPTRTGDILGTPRYMAPEQAAPVPGGPPVGPATDVYGLGVILFELIAGQPPFNAESAAGTLLKVINDEPPALSKLRRGVPRDLETIVRKCLEKDPARRYPDAGQLADDLHRFRENEPIHARKVSETERLWKWAKRRPALASSLAAVMLLTVAGLVAVSVAWSQAREFGRNEAILRKRTEDERDRAERSVYFGTVAQARSQWQLNNVAASARLLDQAAPERRGWEWAYLRGLNDPSLFTISDLEGTDVNAIAYRGDGKSFAIGGGTPYQNRENGFLRVCDEQGHVKWKADFPVPVWSVAFSPDGRLLAAATNDWFVTGPGEVGLWDAETGQRLPPWPGMRTAAARHVAFSPDGKRLAIGGTDNFARVFDRETGEVFHVEHKEFVWRVAFSPDGRWFASTSSGSILCDAGTGRKIRDVATGDSSIAFSDDSSLLASVSWSSVKVWSVAMLTNQPEAEVPPVHSFSGHDGPILGLALHPDGRSLATSGSDGTVRLWDLGTGYNHAVLRGHRGRVSALAFHPDGRSLASGGVQPSDVRVWDLTRPVEYIPAIVLGGAKLEIDAIGFNPAGELNVLAKGGKRFRWNPADGRDTEIPGVPSTWDWLSPAVPAALSADGKRIAVIAQGSPTVVKVLPMDAESPGVDLRGHTVKVMHVAIDSTGSRIATVGNGQKDELITREIKVWDANTGTEIGGITDTERLPIFCMALSPDGTRLAEAGTRKHPDEKFSSTEIRLYSLAYGKLGEPRVLSVINNYVRTIAFSADGRSLAVGYDPGLVQIWDTTTGQEKLSEPLRGLTFVMGLAFNPDGTRIAGVSRERVHLWDTTSGQEILSLQGAPRRPTDNAFNPFITWSADGKRLAASNWDRTVSVWTAEDPGDPKVLEMRQRQAASRALAYHRERAERKDIGQTPFSTQFHQERWKRLEEQSP